MATIEIPNELYSRKNFFTLSGTAAAVWMLCLVLSNLDKDNSFIAVGAYKFIALALSEAFAIYMVLRDRRKTHKENYLIAVFNGLLIFINASGINAFTNNLSFSRAPLTAKVIQHNTGQDYNAGFLATSIFYNEVDWWPNAKKEQQLEDLKQKIAIYEEVSEAGGTSINMDGLTARIRALEDALKNCEINKRTATGALKDDQAACDIIIDEKNEEITDLERRLARCEASKQTDDSGAPANYDDQSRAIRRYKSRIKNLEGVNKKLLDSIKYCTQWKPSGKQIN